MFDKKEFARLLELAKGDRSINEYAKECGVSSAHISRLLRCLLDTPPNPETIKKIASKAKNGVTYEDLMKAAGHILNGTQAPEPSRPWQPTLTEKDKKDIAKELEKLLNDLEHSEGLAFFNGEPLDEETKEHIKNALKLGLEIAKIKNKQKYTPRKYRKS
ncbi:immunity repressor protein (phage-related protein) [Caldicellulosiruptor hydrothermalis 108]|uniref:Immunity repressor protein (Phage-related protein) n=1 Tax=Caldicellulosiruptor hydrothermalis (strain DSM 18901 / VKM B-2411 / 108) TaxID=632292 RepID=E4QDQ3_CALH1|nr:DNA-binding protein [Caldicellulosiruptor hydrothermalis]ADQ06470.1 immunity repressor protein (phage-related protein) [Caldicellulosiruptor hydrothermalis 108]